MIKVFFSGEPKENSLHIKKEVRLIHNLHLLIPVLLLAGRMNLGNVRMFLFKDLMQKEIDFGETMVKEL